MTNPGDNQTKHSRGETSVEPNTDAGDLAISSKHSKKLERWTAVLVVFSFCTFAMAAVPGLVLAVMMVRQKHSSRAGWAAVIYFAILFPFGLFAWIDLAAEHTPVVPGSIVRYCAHRHMNTTHLAPFPSGAHNMRYSRGWLRNASFHVRCDMSRKDFDQWVKAMDGMGSKKIGGEPHMVRIVTYEELNRLQMQAMRTAKDFDLDNYITIINTNIPWWTPTDIMNGSYAWKDVGPHPRGYYDDQKNMLYFNWR